MTESPPAPMPPTPPFLAVRSRFPLIIGIAAGIVAVGVIFIGVQIAIGAFGAKPLVPYTAEAEHYAVTGPGDPTQKESIVMGVIPTTLTRWTDGEPYYSVTSVDLDGGSIPPSQRGAFLHFALVGALADAPGVTEAGLESDAVADAFLREPDQITLGGDPAFHFTLAVEGASTPFHVVFAGHPPMLFMLVYSESTDDRDDDFLDSFSFVD